MLIDFSPVGLLLNVAIVGVIVAAIVLPIRRAIRRRDERVRAKAETQQRRED